MTPKGIDHDNVTAWLQDRIDDLTPPIRFRLIEGGHSNLTFAVADELGERWVLRRPPLFQILHSAHDMGREHKVISALASSEVPVPLTVGYCDDLEVNDSPFYVMEFVPGTVMRSSEIASRYGSARLEGVAHSLVKTLVGIHSIDVGAVGLADLGRSDGYIERQLKRWMRQFDSSKTVERPQFVEVYEHLVTRVPEQSATGLVHGDFRLDNCIFGDDARVAAVLDWELCTLGDVMADVAQLMTYWARPSDTFYPTDVTPTLAAGFCEREQLLEWYEQASGHRLDKLGFYLAFTSWRLAAILEGVYSRYINGAMGDRMPEGGPDHFVGRIQALITAAAAHSEDVS